MRVPRSWAKPHTPPEGHPPDRPLFENSKKEGRAGEVTPPGVKGRALFAERILLAATAAEFADEGFSG